MSKRILLIQGHPDGSEPHLCHALAANYAEGGHLLRQIRLDEIDFPLLRSQKDWEKGLVPASLKPAQDDIVWAEHIVFFFPLWLDACQQCSRASSSKWPGPARLHARGR